MKRMKRVKGFAKGSRRIISYAHIRKVKKFVVLPRLSGTACRHPVRWLGLAVQPNPKTSHYAAHHGPRSRHDGLQFVSSAFNSDATVVIIHPHQQHEPFPHVIVTKPRNIFVTAASLLTSLGTSRSTDPADNVSSILGCWHAGHGGHCCSAGGCTG